MYLVHTKMIFSHIDIFDVIGDLESRRNELHVAVDTIPEDEQESTHSRVVDLYDAAIANIRQIEEEIVGLAQLQ